jgi:hypothetical protein
MWRTPCCDHYESNNFVMKASTGVVVPDASHTAGQATSLPLIRTDPSAPASSSWRHLQCNHFGGELPGGNRGVTLNVNLSKGNYLASTIQQEIRTTFDEIVQLSLAHGVMIRLYAGDDSSLASTQAFIQPTGTKHRRNISSLSQPEPVHSTVQRGFS